MRKAPGGGGWVSGALTKVARVRLGYEGSRLGYKKLV